MKYSSLRTLPVLLFALAAPLAGVACSDVGQNSEFATDSFSRPTEHGVLAFDAKNPAEFTDEDRFHSWTFTLTGAADVELTTEIITQNLDTVMYLYRKGEDGNWGRNIATNDDHDGLGSKIAKSLEAGEYRIKVKGAKTLLRGSFAIDAVCDGAGCPTSGGGTCDVTDTSYPSTHGYTLDCNSKLARIISTPSIPADTSCFETRALELYGTYWNDFIDYDINDAEVDVVSHGAAGAVASVTFGGDEDAMDFVFDEEGKLIYWYQHNQSPDWGWHCEGDVIEEPSEECTMDVIYNQNYSAGDTTTGSGTVEVSGIASINGDQKVKHALTQYSAVYGLGSDAEIVYEYTSWEKAYEGGATVTMLGSDDDNTYPHQTFVITGVDDDNAWVFSTDEVSGATQFVCQGL